MSSSFCLGSFPVSLRSWPEVPFGIFGDGLGDLGSCFSSPGMLMWLRGSRENLSEDVKMIDTQHQGV